MSTSIELDEVGAGQRRWLSLDVATDADMSSITVETCVVRGGNGPTLWIQGALHGSEHVGGLALRDFLNEVDPEEVTGTIIGIPVANPTAFAAKQRLTGVDGRDANRSFPGSEEGYFSEMLANALFDAAVEHADSFVDLHNGGNEYDVPGFCIYSETEDEVEAESLELCKASDLPYAVGIDKEFGGSMGTEIVDRGIPAAVVEVGGKGHVADDYYEQNRHAIENVAKAAGVLPGDPENRTETSVHSELTWLHASDGGFFEPQVDANETVDEGDELARVTDLRGETLETLRAPYDGVVVCMRSYPMARPGDWAVELTPLND